MMMKILHLSQNKKKYLMNLQMKGLKKWLIQIKKINIDDLIYRYKGNTADVKFNKFDNALNIINKIRNGEIIPADVKNNEEKLKSYLGKIKKETKNIDQKSKTALCEILTCFTK